MQTLLKLNKVSQGVKGRLISVYSSRRRRRKFQKRNVSAGEYLAELVSAISKAHTVGYGVLTMILPDGIASSA